jgi:hypothetical protein
VVDKRLVVVLMESLVTSVLLYRKKKFAEKRERLEGEEGESRGGCLVAGWWLC